MKIPEATKQAAKCRLLFALCMACLFSIGGECAVSQKTKPKLVCVRLYAYPYRTTVWIETGRVEVIAEGAKKFSENEGETPKLHRICYLETSTLEPRVVAAITGRVAAAEDQFRSLRPRPEWIVGDPPTDAFPPKLRLTWTDKDIVYPMPERLQTIAAPKSARAAYRKLQELTTVVTWIESTHTTGKGKLPNTIISISDPRAQAYLRDVKVTQRILKTTAGDSRRHR